MSMSVQIKDGSKRPARSTLRSLQVLGIAVSASLLVGACAEDRFIEQHTPFMSVSERHPIKLSEEPEYLEVAVGPGSRGLTATQRNQVAAFIAQYKTRAQGELTIRMPSGTRNEGAARHTLHGIRRVVTEQGVPARSVKYKAYRERSLGAYPPIVIAYKGLKAVADQCGNWPSNLAHNPGNVVYDDFGCSTQRNLAAMVANPLDLEQPRQTDPASAARRDTIYKKYVKGEPTASKTDSGAGNLSGVGE